MSLVGLAVCGVAGLLVLVVGLRLHAFLALLLVSVAVGLGAGMEPVKVLEAVEKGMGGTLGFIAIVVGLGGMFGQMLEESGGAQRLADTLVSSFGIERARWALTLTGFLVAIPVFFDVGFILLVPLVYSVSRKTHRPLVGLALPLLAGLTVAHAFIPPTPGPMAVARVLGADLGRVIVYGIVAGLPAVVIAGPLLSGWMEKRIPQQAPESHEPHDPDQELPPFGTVLALMLVPLLLIVANTVSAAMAPGTTVARWLTFLGHPFVALTLATLLAFYLLGVRRGWKLSEIQDLASRGLGPTGLIILVTGAGGVFKQILTDSGIGKELAQSMVNFGLSPVAFAFLVAAVVRISQGSATVSMMTAAGFVAPLLSAFPHVDKALLTIAIAAGASGFSHVNDSGFWLVKQYLGLSEWETLSSWTVMTTVLGIVGLISALVMSTFL